MGGEGGFNIEGAPKTMFQDENIFLYHLTIDMRHRMAWPGGAIAARETPRSFLRVGLLLFFA
jgi:hypothetical protein